jgi:hypothetical protein
MVVVVDVVMAVVIVVVAVVVIVVVVFVVMVVVVAPGGAGAFSWKPEGTTRVLLLQFWAVSWPSRSLRVPESDSV